MQTPPAVIDCCRVPLLAHLWHHVLLAQPTAADHLVLDKNPDGGGARGTEVDEVGGGEEGEPAGAGAKMYS